MEFNTLKSLERLAEKKKLAFTKLCDDIKNKYCEINKIKLVRIPYYDIKNIDEILSKILIHHTDFIDP